MSDIDTARLRALAEAAPQDEFQVIGNCVYSLTEDGRTNRLWADVYAHGKLAHNAEADALAAYIAAANPQTMLALLDRIAELERERDAMKFRLAGLEK